MVSSDVRSSDSVTSLHVATSRDLRSVNFDAIVSGAIDVKGRSRDVVT